MAELFFIRHGEIEVNVNGISTGRLEANLTHKVFMRSLKRLFIDSDKKFRNFCS